MTAFCVILVSMVIGWLAYEYLTPWGTVAKQREQDGRND